MFAPLLLGVVRAGGLNRPDLSVAACHAVAQLCASNHGSQEAAADHGGVEAAADILRAMVSACSLCHSILAWE
jgi:mannose/fructose/N-acetylgalactosamine-specific phosphotransferase system component IIC